MAKPTVDILLEVDWPEACANWPQRLSEQGWLLMHEQQTPYWTMLFNKGYTPQGFAQQVYHLHVREYGDWDELYFRDYLLAHPETAAAYAQLKRDLFNDYQYNRDGYTAGKTAFVQEISRLARQEFPDRYKPHQK